MKDWTSWSCIVVILFVQFFLTQTQIKFFLFEIDISLFTMVGLFEHLLVELVSIASVFVN